jgi:hypothetical protein
MAQSGAGARNLLIGLGVLVVLLAAVTFAVVGKDWLSDALGKKNEAPTLMIVSSQMLQTGAEANKTSDDKLKAFADASGPGDAKAPAAKGEPAKTDAKADAAKPAPLKGDVASDNRSLSQARATDLKLLADTMEDSLGGRVAMDFSGSGRFRLIAQAKVIDAMDAYAKQNKVAPANLMNYLSGKTASTTRAAGGATRTGVAEEAAVMSHGVTDVARTVGADYTLVITIGEPRFTQDYVAGTNGQTDRLVLSAQPEINCEIFSTKGKEAYRFNRQMDRPIIETVVGGDGVALKGEYLAKLVRLNERMSAEASAEVLAWALDKIAPARLVKADGGMIINRGTNDGVAAGAVYSVERETGEAIHDDGAGGADLGKQRVPVGSIKVDQPQERIATVEIASGGPFKKGDIVKIVAGAKGAGDGSPGPSASSGADSDPLGSRAINEAGAAKAAGVTVHKVNLAVDHIHVTAGGKTVEDLDEAQAVSAALANDPRIAILPRAEMAKLNGERALNQRASGQLTMDPDEGLAVSGYLVDGDFTVTSSKHTTSITVAGVSTPTSSSTSTAVTGTLRVTKMDGRLVQTVRFTAPSKEAAANVAARALLLQIFPMSVVQVGPPGTIRVNRGQDAGLAVGAHLQLYHRGAPIVDKSTGALLSEGARTLIGEATITDVEPNIATAQVVGSTQVAEGDLAQLGAGPAPAKAAGPAAGKAAAKRAAAPAKQPDSGIHF